MADENVDENVEGTPPKTVEPPKPQTFTQDDINRIVKKETEKLTKKSEEEKNSLQKQLDELKAQIVPPPKDDDLKGRLELAQRTHEREKTALQGEIDKLRAENTAISTKYRESLRDAELTEALQAANCVDIRGGIKYFKDDTVWDEDEGAWKAKTTKGNLVPIKDCVAEELPPYMRSANIAGGGSGTGKGTPGKTNAKAKELEQAKAERDKWAEKFKKTNDTRAMTEYSRAKARVRSLEVELGLNPSA